MKRIGLLMALLPIFSTGCFLSEFTTITSRSQLDEPEPAKDGMLTIGEVSIYDNATDLVVSGVGIVVGLNGTGAPCPPGDVRNMLTERLKREKVENIADFLDSPNSAAVVLTAVVKPGVRKGELIDVEVTLPQGSKVRNLRGGILLESPLMTFSTQAEVRDFLKQNEITPVSEGNRLLKGHEVMLAKGPLHAPLEQDAEGDKSTGLTDKPLKRAYVWRGGQTLDGRAMYLVLNTDQQRYRVAEQVALRVNETFHAGDTPSSKFAVARHKDLIAVAVPPRYRLNRPHFQRVLRAIPLDPPADQSAYLTKLETQLADPETSAQAAIRLEAMGSAGVSVLRGALKSEYPFVRFCAAEALAYLNQPIAAEVLAKCAAEHPSVQAYALTALAALDDAAAISRLEELLAVRDSAVRYGAFRALREIDPKNDLIRGVWAGRSFALHEITNNGPSMVHILSQGRAEVTVFGATPKLTAPFSIMVGTDMTITARPGDTLATISRFSAKIGPEGQHSQCDLKVTDIMRTMVDMGATYAEVADMLTKAHERKALSCKLVRDALPKAVPMTKLAEAAREDPYMKLEYDLLEEFEAATSNLYDNGRNDAAWRKD